MVIGEVAKALTTAFGAAATSMTTAMQNGHMEFWEWFTVAGSFVVGFLFAYFTDNTAANRPYKAVAAVLAAIVAWLGTAFLDGSVSSDEYVGLATAAITAFMTWYTPNAPSSVNGV